MAQPEFAREWLRQRESGAGVIAEVERRELVALDDETALVHIEAVLSLPLPRLTEDRRTSSGFVEQQRLFAKSRSAR
jgi:hypothetical protein